MARALVAVEGALINATDSDGDTPLHCARPGRESVILLLIEIGTNPSIANNQHKTPLNREINYIDIARALLAKGAGPANDADPYGNTPLHLAIMYGYSTLTIESVILLLLTLGVDPSIANNDQQTPLYFACRRGFVDVAQAVGPRSM